MHSIRVIQDIVETVLPFTGTFVSAFFVLLFISYLMLRTFRQSRELRSILADAENKDALQRDPWRIYKFAPKKRIMRRSQSRCEWHSSTGDRCTISKDLEVDHIYPWAAGGWTIENNAQVLCHPHHMLKGGLVPEPEAIEAIELNRKSYFPEDMETEVRWRPTPEERNLHNGNKG